MNDATLEMLLEQLRQQNYPLEVSADAADAIVECIRRIMAAVPEDDRIFLRADFDSATSALCHPSPSRNEIG